MTNDEKIASLPPGLRTSPEKTRSLLDELRSRPALNEATEIARFVDLTVAETIQVCVGAIRLRAEWMGNNGYTSGTAEAVRHIAFWLESDAGKETLEVVDAETAKAIKDRSKK